MRILTLFLSLIYTSLIVPTIVIIPDITASYVYGVDIPKEALKVPQGAFQGERNEDLPIYRRELEDTEDVKEFIKWNAEVLEIDVGLAEDLARIESNFEPHAQNAFSTAYGPYQWLQGSWKDLCQSDTHKPSRKDPKENIKCAHWQIHIGNLQPWLVATSTRNKLEQLGYLDN